MTDRPAGLAGVDELIAGSAASWRDAAPAPRLPAELSVDRSVPLWRPRGWARRASAWRRRHLLRRSRAESFYAESRHPERGLPVARNPKAFAFVGRLLATRKAIFAAVLAANALAAVAGLIVPRLLGDLVDAATGGAAPAASEGVLGVVVALVVAQALLTVAARAAAAVFGYGMLAAAREEIVRRVLRLPLGHVEAAASGDLLTRITSDVSKMSASVRWAFPHLVMSTVMIALSLVALGLNSWFLALPILPSLAVLFVVGRGYLRRAAAGYIAESGTYSQINSTMTETVEGARTVEALGLGEVRGALLAGDVEVSAQAERYTMSLRNMLFGFLDLSYQLPQVGVVLLGTVGYARGWVTIGQIAAASLYLQQLVGPLDRLIAVFDHLQVGLAATTRLLGVDELPDDRTPSDAVPAGERVAARDLRFAYRAGHDVLHGVDLDLRPGERLAVVGPSGSGKSTLGRLVAGVNRPRTGSVRVGGVDVMDLPLDRLRTEVALVTQEHHVFVGSLRDNVVLAREGRAGDAEVRAALEAVDALDWVDRLPRGLDTVLGHGRLELTPAQAQQVALARLVLADPHTLVLDEATSLIDPRTARHLEGSLAALLEGRSVVAIAHRLHTAHDADRIAVVIDGRVAELGSHQELLAAGGEYARLWRTWRS